MNISNMDEEHNTLQHCDNCSLDMQRAIFDMKTDQVLQQYHYFVGSAKNLFMDNTDGWRIAKF